MLDFLVASSLLIPFYIGYRWLHKTLVRPYQAKRKFYHWANAYPRKQTHELLTALYQGISGWQLAKMALAKRGWQDNRFTYGEIPLFTFAAVLDKAQPKPEDVFYDLGCGVGKTVLAAALLYKLKKAVGIEYFPEIHAVCLQCADTLRRLPRLSEYFPDKELNLEFQQGDLLDANIQDATIVFINATCFIGEQWLAIEEKLEGIQPGSRIILVTRSLASHRYKLLEHGVWPMSWGKAAVRVYLKQS